MPSPSSEGVGGRSPAATSSGTHSLGDFYPQVIPCHHVKGTLQASPLSLFSAKLTTLPTEAGHSGWEVAVRAEGSSAELGGGRAGTELGQQVPSDSGRALRKGCLIRPASPTLHPERTAPQGPALCTDKECLRLACGHLPQDTGLSRAWDVPLPSGASSWPVGQRWATTQPCVVPSNSKLTGSKEQTQTYLYKNVFEKNILYSCWPSAGSHFGVLGRLLEANLSPITESRTAPRRPRWVPSRAGATSPFCREFPLSL